MVTKVVVIGLTAAAAGLIRNGKRFPHLATAKNLTQEAIEKYLTHLEYTNPTRQREVSRIFDWWIAHLGTIRAE